ncbi:DUF4244 domain-containing protein [Bifidobacterium sp. MA2]|uniref:DUF4244 domain-containing protein n=1 Tax=Bifidobacterium santillanense TaxID=2809028 RepID=A0ABS5USE6_9BIFI|nr:DUF4244 domain-containing protein [Bifidobacterium santillanense]MBT1173726.1 DUF4244 domain-containing protein [Bifidobacterium santillanense]
MMNTKIKTMLTGAKARLYLLDSRIRTLGMEPEEGAATAEYAAVTVAAVGLGGVLWTVLKSKEFQDLVKLVLKTAFEAITKSKV